MTLHMRPEEKKAHQLANRRKWVEANQDKVKAYHVKYNQKETTKARKHEWGVQNRDTINRRRREQYAVKQSVSQLVRSSDE